MTFSSFLKILLHRHIKLFLMARFRTSTGNNAIKCDKNIIDKTAGRIF